MSAFRAVESVLETYFDGLYHCDTARLTTVFHPRAIYATADESPPLYRSLEEYLSVVAKRQSPASRGDERRDHIDAIEFAGANTAFARIRCTIGSRDFVDFLTLVHEAGRWRIIAKVFQIIDLQRDQPASIGRPH